MTRRTRTVIAVLLVLAAGVVIALVATSSSGSSGPDPAACKAAMSDQFSYGMQHPDAPAGTKPDACQGVPDKDLQRFASEIMQDYMNGAS